MIILRSVCLALVLVASLFCQGCLMVAPVVPPAGLLYTDVTAPLDVRAEGAIGPKKGMAMMTCYLWLVANGDASIEAAARNGGITDINGVDYHYTNLFGVVQTYTTIVHGQ